MQENGSYTMKIFFEGDIMKVEYTEIINFGVDFKQILFFDARKQ